jgi:hypothetical protein
MAIMADGSEIKNAEMLAAYFFPAELDLLKVTVVDPLGEYFRPSNETKECDAGCSSV